MAPWSSAQSGWIDQFYKEKGYIPSLIPGEKRTLKCVVPQQVAEVESVTLTVSGWNVPEKKIKLFLDGMK